MIFLASLSPRRRDLLSQAGLRYRCIPSAHEEIMHAALSPEDNALWNALLKCSRASVPSAAARQRRGIVLAADTLIDFKGQAVIKPKDRNDAARMLARFAGRTHTVITAVALKDLSAGCYKTFTVKSKVTFKKLSAKQIQSYLDTGEYKDKAGAYGYQEHGRALVARVRGSESNVIGLPLEQLLTVLRKLKR
jgi:septum formation protein